MKLHKLYLSLAAGALSALPVVAAETAPVVAPAPAKAPAKAEAPKADIWAKVPDVVAVVDGKNITKAELIAFVKSKLGEIPPQVTADMIAQYAPSMVEGMVMDNLTNADFKASKIVVTKEEAVKMLQEQFRNMPAQQQQQFNMLLKSQNMTFEQFIEKSLARPGALDELAQEKFAREVVLKNCDATDEEAKKFYDAHQNEFPEVVSASHILAQVKENATEADKKAALEKINRIAEELKKNPAAFEEIAKKESDCPSKAQGGKLGEFPRRQMDPEFEKAAFALKQGEISGVVKSQFGYHIIRCDAAPARVTFDKAKNDLKQMLTQQKVEQAAKAYAEGLKKKHNVQILVKAPELPAPTQAAPAAPAAPAAK